MSSPLKLRPLEREDLPFVHELDNNESVMHYWFEVELVEINHIHRRAEFQIIIAPGHQGKGYATLATNLAIDYAFSVLNLYKLSLIVDCENARAVHVYRKLGFQDEGCLRHEFFVGGEYRDVFRMAMFQPDYLVRRKMG
jgi:diamine N-acetyltransferase